MKFDKIRAGAAALFLVLLAVYSQHFNNSFHFDDSHTIVQNPAIRDLHHVGRLLTDGSAFSILTTNRGWRPLLTLSLAVDYKIAGGANPWAFHVDSFCLFLIHVAAVYYLYRSALGSRGWALCGAALFGLHPVMAETVNYIIQRGDLMASLGCTAGVALYARGNRLYWLAFLFAGMSKPTGVVFPLLVGAFMILVEGKFRWKTWLAIATLGGILVLCHHFLTPPSYNPGGTNKFAYWWTQPYVVCTYVASLFCPTNLVADNDLGTFPSPWTMQARLGYLGIIALLGLTAWSCRRGETRVIGYGIIWFFSALILTCIIPLAEVTNDHRMFFADVGLILALVKGLSLIPDRFQGAIKGLICMVLLACCWATFGRNQVWHSEDSLWREVTEKAPLNGRGWMNYGLTFMQKGDWDNARRCFLRAAELTPNYPSVFINLGILEGSTGNAKAAEDNFAKAQRLGPGQPEGYFYEARSLRSKEPARAVSLLEQALKAQPDHFPSQQLLLDVGIQQRDWGLLKKWLPALNAGPEAAARIETEKVREMQQAENMPESAERYVQISFIHYKLEDYEKSIAVADEGLKRYPESAELHNNQAADWLALKEWKRAASAAEIALRLRPDWQLAQNNLEYANSKISK